uniref:COesterase domain-containing protein n=1 Tax=Ascaris lumbricoides TaxID=6252 RepID=A0A0M3HVD2_ASCLU
MFSPFKFLQSGFIETFGYFAASGKGPQHESLASDFLSADVATCKPVSFKISGTLRKSLYFGSGVLGLLQLLFDDATCLHAFNSSQEPWDS